MRDRQDRLLRGIGRGFWVAVTALGLIAATVVALQIAQRRADAWVRHTREIGRLARQAELQFIIREQLVRTHLAGEAPRLALADSVNREALRLGLDSLALGTRVPEQRARLQALLRLIGGWESAFAAPAMAAAPDERRRWREQLSAVGASLVEPIRTTFAAFLVEEDHLYREGVEQRHRLRLAALLILLTELAVVAAVLIGFRRTLLLRTRELLEQQEQLEMQATELEEQAIELEHQTEQAQDLAQELELSNEELNEALSSITSAREAEQRALEEKAAALSQLEAALGSAPVGFAFFDRDLRYVRVNPALAALSGRPPEEYVGRTPREIVPALADDVEPALRRVLATGEPVLDVEVSGPTPTGTRRRSFLSSFYPVRGSDGALVGAGVVVAETTERRQLEAELQQAQKMEAVGQLAGGVAHDFNNVLTAIRSFSELLLADVPAGSPQRADLLEIQGAADRAAALTRQLLAFSRRQLLQPEVLDLNEIVRGLEEMLRRLLGEDIDCVWRLDPDLDLALVDRGQVEQIVVNLAVNARDAMPGGGRLTVQTVNVQIDEAYASGVDELTPGHYVVLAVSDTGIGMDAETRARIFEPFFTTKGPAEGTGLGLSTVYGIVKQSRGHVTVYSEPGNGTTLRIYLPRAAQDAARAQRAVTAPGEVQGGDETVLLVEDDPAVRLVTQRILARLGYRVLEAASPSAAEAIVARHPGCIDLVMTDLVLPEMSGRELVSVLTTVEPRLRVLFMSGYTNDAVVRRGLLTPGMPFLSKPFTVESMGRAVRSALDRGVGELPVAGRGVPVG